MSIRAGAVMLALIAGNTATIASSAAASAAIPAAATSAPSSGLSLPTIERKVMCVTCKIPLSVAQSPQADRERAYIQALIVQGETEAQIKHALVDQYGPTVLGLPSAHGFGLAAYLVPLAAFAALLAALATLLPRWRRQARAHAIGEPTAGRSSPLPLDPTDAARLDADLARFD
jgi:cytochrome c-type biogenesis protein CcmH